MTTPLDDRLVPRVLDIIARYGKVLAYSVTTGATYNPATSRREGGSTAVHQVKSTPPTGYSHALIGTSGIQAGDQHTLVAAKDLPFDPKVATGVQVDGKDWTIVTVKPIRSGELVAAWDFQIRG